MSDKDFEIARLQRRIDLLKFHITRQNSKAKSGQRSFKAMAEDRDWYRRELREARKLRAI